jgi:hypothetical protein
MTEEKRTGFADDRAQGADHRGVGLWGYHHGQPDAGYNAVSTFPGLEVDNSFVASQNFNQELAEQLALGWDVRASHEDGVLTLAITDSAGQPVQVAYLDAVLGAATHVRDDQTPDFRFTRWRVSAPRWISGAETGISACMPWPLMEPNSASALFCIWADA